MGSSAARNRWYGYVLPGIQQHGRKGPYKGLKSDRLSGSEKSGRDFSQHTGPMLNTFACWLPGRYIRDCGPLVRVHANASSMHTRAERVAEIVPLLRGGRLPLHSRAA